jgi:hypothetical protein
VAALRAKGASGACACSVRTKGKAEARIEPYIATEREWRGEMEGANGWRPSIDGERPSRAVGPSNGRGIEGEGMAG